LQGFFCKMHAGGLSEYTHSAVGLQTFGGFLLQVFLPESDESQSPKSTIGWIALRNKPVFAQFLLLTKKLIFSTFLIMELLSLPAALPSQKKNS
jgi:hypothetical protein